ncbi:MAG TPA: hypothetical protein VKR06_18560 [Ktedonosporobacter sp.]|nr:hypothetical protein [Ktedonosporobacter sp.]
MEMQHQSVSSLARWAQNVYVALAGLILLGIFTQGFLIGAMLFGGSASGRQAHGLLGMILVVFVLLQAISGLLTPFPSLIKWGSWLLFALVVIQIMLPSLGAVAGSLHPANATLLFGVDVFLLVRAWQWRRSK